MAEFKYISPGPYKNFIAARASLEREFLDGKKILRYSYDAKIRIPAGYSLYYLSGNSLHFCDAFPLGGDLGGEKLGDLLKKTSSDRLINLYWVRSEGGEFAIPWGIRGKKINGTVSVGIADSDRFLCNPGFIWEHEMCGGVEFHYLSEYFIDGDRKQNGFSIVLRDKLLGSIERIVGLPPVNSDALAEAIFRNEEVGKILESNGLKWATGTRSDVRVNVVSNGGEQS